MYLKRYLQEQNSNKVKKYINLLHICFLLFSTNSKKTYFVFRSLFNSIFETYPKDLPTTGHDFTLQRLHQRSSIYPQFSSGSSDGKRSGPKLKKMIKTNNFFFIFIEKIHFKMCIFFQLEAKNLATINCTFSGFFRPVVYVRHLAKIL